MALSVKAKMQVRFPPAYFAMAWLFVIMSTVQAQSLVSIGRQLPEQRVFACNSLDAAQRLVVAVRQRGRQPEGCVWTTASVTPDRIELSIAPYPGPALICDPASTLILAHPFNAGESKIPVRTAVVTMTFYYGHILFADGTTGWGWFTLTDRPYHTSGPKS
jgi:hypothetical protein